MNSSDRFQRPHWFPLLIVGLVIVLARWSLRAGAYVPKHHSDALVADPSDLNAHPFVGPRPDALNVVGRWTLKGNIQRDIVLRADGTATLHVKLDLLSSLVYGQKLRMELTWSRKDDVLTHTIVSGEPAANVERLARDFGATRNYRILQLTSQELLLKDVDPSDPEEYRWRRAAETSP